MKKYVALLLCLLFVTASFSCNSTGREKNDITASGTEKNIVTTQCTEKNQDNTSADKKVTVISNHQYYKIEHIALTQVRYYIYNSNGDIVLSGETERPLTISMLDTFIVDIRIGMGTGLTIHKYYDVVNDRFSNEYSYVAAASRNLVAYIDGTSLNSRKLIVRDIFDSNVLYKEFALDFSPNEHTPIEYAEFTVGENELNITYLTEISPVSVSQTLPIR